MMKSMKVLSSFRLSSLQNSKYIRTLYNRQTIGVEDYENVRKKFDGPPEFYQKFRAKMQDLCEKDSQDYNDMIFTDDLKQFLHIVTAEPEDLSLAEKMIIKFQKQNSHLRFGSYSFGPVVMRFYHSINKPDEALKMYYNPALDGFFDQLSSYVVFMDLLFRNEKYAEIIDLYKKYRDKQLSFGKFPKSVMVLVFAAYYKINTEAAFKSVMQIWQEMNEGGVLPLRRVTSFAAALAVNQNSPHIALEMLSVVQNQKYVLVRCVKALAFSSLGRFDDVVPILTSVLFVDAPNVPKQTFPADLIKSILEMVEKSGNVEAKLEIERIEKQLNSQGYISPSTLNDVLLTEITVSEPINKTKSVLNAAYENPANNMKKPHKIFKRPGILDRI